MENIVFGLEIMVIGFTTVIIILYLLYLILLGFSRFAPKSSIKTKQNSQEIVPAIAIASDQHQGQTTSPEVVAVITAAISAYLHLPAGQFKIVAIMPEQASSDWAMAGRNCLMEKRQNLAIFRREKTS
ncbi:MAG: OadG family protein [Firmicutes bacterium]|nr:OadG family protein [Bacillota bacterium]